jgi:hypothetical protein
MCIAEAFFAKTPQNGDSVALWMFTLAKFVSEIVGDSNIQQLLVHWTAQ